VAILKQDDAAELSYRGTVSREKHHLVFRFDSVNHAENVLCRFPDPLGKICTSLYGIWLAYDHDQNVAAGGIFLTKEPINNTDPLREIAAGFDLPRGRPQLRVMKRK
jgi:hypothetical protein